MLFAFAAFANTLMAAGNLKVNIVPLTSEKAVVAITNNTASNFNISIQNSYGETIYYKETASDNKDYRKVFDFSNLTSGDYTLTATINGETTERKFTVGNNKIAVGNEKTAIDPYFTFKDGMLAVSFLNFSQEDLLLNFYDNNGLVYSNKIGDQFAVTKGFDLSKLARGNYTVILSTPSKSYDYYVNVD